MELNMVQFDKPFLPALGSSVMVGGKSPEQRVADLELGHARIGGIWRHPNYFESYLLSAKALINYGASVGTLDDIGLPAFYLQRHALELLLKAMLVWILDISDMRAQLASPEHQVDTEQRHAVLHGHDHSELLKRLHEWVMRIGWEAPPKSLDHLVQRFKQIEITETWARYSTSRKRKKGSPTIAHVPDETVIPLLSLQGELEALAGQLVSRAHGEDSYEIELYREWCRLDATLNE
jgi:hypothetical protein